MLSQVPFFQLKTILTYKAQALGKRVVTVSPEYTSQEDCRTSERAGVRKCCRYFCNDGCVFDTDWNAAINISKRYKHSKW
jgi:transposase